MTATLEIEKLDESMLADSIPCETLFNDGTCGQPSVARAWARCQHKTDISFVCQECLDLLRAGKLWMDNCECALMEWREL